MFFIKLFLFDDNPGTKVPSPYVQDLCVIGLFYWLSRYSRTLLHMQIILAFLGRQRAGDP